MKQQLDAGGIRTHVFALHVLSPIELPRCHFAIHFLGYLCLSILELTLAVQASATNHGLGSGYGTSFLPQASRLLELFPVLLRESNLAVPLFYGVYQFKTMLSVATNRDNHSYVNTHDRKTNAPSALTSACVPCVYHSFYGDVTFDEKSRLF